MKLIKMLRQDNAACISVKAKIKSAAYSSVQ